MKWKNKNGKIIETDDITDIKYLHNLINFLIERVDIDKSSQFEIGFDGGFFYKD